MELGAPEWGWVVAEGAECFVSDSHKAIFRTLDDTCKGGGGRMLYLR